MFYGLLLTRELYYYTGGTMMINLFTWDESYLVNIEKLDKHHQKLMTLFNKLHNDLHVYQDIAQKSPLIEKALTELINYSFYHFQAEEELMIKYDYPNYISHKTEHDRFKLQVNQLMEQHKESAFGMAFPVLHFINEWLTTHIINVDKQYEPYLQNDQKP